MNVSVIVPTYNRGAKLAGTLDSLLGNNVSGIDGIEIIVVDDGSMTPAALVVDKCIGKVSFELSLVGRNDRKWVRRPTIETPTDRMGRRFFQYAYSPREFKRELTAEGFRLVTTQGYSIIWGLYEIPWLAQMMSKFEQCRSLDRPKSQAATSTSQPNGASRTSHGRTSLLKRILIGEDDTVPVAGVIIRALRWACANMMRYVCIRSEHRLIS